MLDMAWGYEQTLSPGFLALVCILYCKHCRRCIVCIKCVMSEQNKIELRHQGGFDGRGQPTASPMLTAIMSGGVGISGREFYKYR